MNWRLTQRKKRALATAQALLALTAPMLLSACGSGLLGTVEEVVEDETPEEEEVVADLCSANMQGVEPILGEPVTLEDLGYNPNTQFRQTVSATQAFDTNLDNPIQVNYWDLNDDLSISDGYSDQFDDVLDLSVSSLDDGGAVTTTSDFATISYNDLSFYGPALGSCNGVIVSKVLENAVYNDISAGGSYHLYVSAIANGKTQQAITIPMTAATLNWIGYDSSETSYFMDAPDTSMQVVLRNPDDNSVLAEASISDGTSGIDVTALVGQDAILSIESTSDGTGYAFLDDLVFKDAGVVAIEDGSIVNGDFESGDLTGWTAVEPSEIQNVTTAAQTLEGVEVTRSFFTIPNKVWGRHTDTIHNPGTETVTIRLTYNSEMGSDDDGFMFPIPSSEDRKALSHFDADGDRDSGFVFGNDATVEFESAVATDATNYTSGTDEIVHTYDLTIPAGGTVTVVNFVIMNGQTTTYYNYEDYENQTGPLFDYTTDRPVEIEEAINDILENFWTDGQYRTGMTQAQIDSIVNF